MSDFFVLAQTFTSTIGPTPPMTLGEILTIVIPVLSALVVAWREKKSWDLKTMFKAAAIGFKAALDSLPPARAEEIKTGVKTDVIEAGGEALNEAMKLLVKKVTQPQSSAVGEKATSVVKEGPPANENRPDGLPKLVLIPLIFALSLVGGCVNAGIHDAAIAVQESAKVLESSADKLKRASVPNPAYNDEEKDAWVLLWTKHQKAITEIQKAIRTVEEASK